MKEHFRAVASGEFDSPAAIEMLDRCIIRASWSRLAPSVKAAKTMRERRGIIVSVIEAGISNRRVGASTPESPSSSAGHARFILPPPPSR